MKNLPPNSMHFLYSEQISSRPWDCDIEYVYKYNTISCILKNDSILVNNNGVFIVAAWGSCSVAAH